MKMLRLPYPYDVETGLDFDGDWLKEDAEVRADQLFVSLDFARVSNVSQRRRNAVRPEVRDE